MRTARQGCRALPYSQNPVHFLSHFHAFGYDWYVFNVADAAIVCGVAALVLDGMFGHKPETDRHDRRDHLAGAQDRR